MNTTSAESGGRSRRGGLLLSFVLVFCVLLLSAQAPGSRRQTSLLQSWILSAAAPIAGLASSVSRAVSGAADSAVDTFSARSENNRLKMTLARQEQELFRLRAEVSQAAREGFSRAAPRSGRGDDRPHPAAGEPRGAAERSDRRGTSSGSCRGLLSRSPRASSGASSGGRDGFARAAPGDASAAVGARIVRTQELGVAKGDGRGLRLNNIATTSRVQVGDVIESAGIDGIYPRGVAIGRIASVARGSNMFLEIRVTPAARFSQLTDVLVLAPSPAIGAAAGGAGSAGP
jgi:rod shape-determining protein MreC